MPTVLIVEDEAITALGLRSLLEDLGCNVPPTAANGSDAFERCARFRPDFVLMDILLQGGMNGIDTGERIEKEYAIPVVYVTANTDDFEGKTAEGIHPFRFITKPVDSAALSELIESMRGVQAV
jgi:CheY-like chemotaxis protein